MILKIRLQQQANLNNVRWEIIEQDYILSWILEGISNVPILRDNMVFKGGTALKKSYFGNYRFSQDLDFSVFNTDVLHKELANHIAFACQIATSKIQILGENIEFKSNPYIEKRPHPEGQQAFIIQARLPWQRDFHTKVYIEVSFQEIIILPPNKLKIIHPYEEELNGKLLVYPLEEIVAEKIRALLQYAKKLHERGWGRSRVRDYYDLWRILKEYSKEIDVKQIPSLTQKKCAHKNVVFNGIEDIFQHKLLENFEKEWIYWLSDIVQDLPDKDQVIKDLRSHFSKIF